LPIAEERASWLVRLGIHTVGQLAALPRDAVAARLGDQASLLLDLAGGHDRSPLIAYQPAPIPVEENSWDDALDGIEPLLFVLRGLVSRLSARLEGRGEAAQVLRLVLEHDPSIARLNQVDKVTTIDFDLATPLWRSDDLWRVLTSRLQKTRLGAPSRGMRVEATVVTRALPLQLNLTEKTGGARGPDAFPVLLAELAADIGKSRFGIFELTDTHRPERQSRLVPVPAAEVLSTMGATPPAVMERDAARRAKSRLPPFRRGAPTRLLPRPLSLDAALRIGATLSVDHQLYTIDQVTFLHRLDAVQWWDKDAISRDYLRLWLKSAAGSLEAWVYVNRQSGTRFLQAICD
jgi:protein ImuB